MSHTTTASTTAPEVSLTSDTTTVRSQPKEAQKTTEAPLESSLSLNLNAFANNMTDESRKMILSHAFGLNASLNSELGKLSEEVVQYKQVGADLEERLSECRTLMDQKNSCEMLMREMERLQSSMNQLASSLGGTKVDKRPKLADDSVTVYTRFPTLSMSPLDFNRQVDAFNKRELNIPDETLARSKLWRDLKPGESAIVVPNGHASVERDGLSGDPHLDMNPNEAFFIRKGGVLEPGQTDYSTNLELHPGAAGDLPDDLWVYGRWDNLHDIEVDYGYFLKTDSPDKVTACGFDDNERIDLSLKDYISSLELKAKERRALSENSGNASWGNMTDALDPGLMSNATAGHFGVHSIGQAIDSAAPAQTQAPATYLSSPEQLQPTLDVAQSTNRGFPQMAHHMSTVDPSLTIDTRVSQCGSRKHRRSGNPHGSWYGHSHPTSLAPSYMGVGA